MFCPECGQDHHAEDRAAAAAVDRDIELAKINAKRDVDVARITANADKRELETEEAIAEIDAEVAVDVATAEAEVIGTILGVGTESAEDTEPEPAPLIITEPPADDGLDLAPPESAHRSTERKSGGGWSFN